jgi:hypothetical protein
MIESLKAISADHPAQGDARVMRITARCGSVVRVPELCLAGLIPALVSADREVGRG